MVILTDNLDKLKERNLVQLGAGEWVYQKSVSAVKQELEQLQGELPAGMELHLVRDDAARVLESIAEVWFDLIIGSIFAVAIVFWFLGDFCAAGENGSADRVQGWSGRCR